MNKDNLKINKLSMGRNWIQILCSIVVSLRLCLVRVKAFPENIPFSENAIFRKGKCFHVFGCISKNFPKNIFWCLEKKKENTNPEKHKPQPRKKIINDRCSTGFDSAVLRELQSNDRVVDRDPRLRSLRDRDLGSRSSD